MNVSLELIAAARWLAEPALDSAILAEGNVSQVADDGEFWVKASGFSLVNITEEGFVKVNGNAILADLDSSLGDDEVRQSLRTATLVGAPAAPSVETFMHAWLLSLPSVTCALHAHPTSLIALSSHPLAGKVCQNRIFPDEIVCCGPATVWVPYTDPGLPLAQAIRAKVTEYIDEWGDFPRTILLGNHGLITLGTNIPQAKSAFQMAVKAGRAWNQCLAAGWPTVLSADSIKRIAGRPDEHYRQRLLWSGSAAAQQQ